MNIEEQIAKKVAEQALSKIDYEKLAADLSPALVKSIKKGILKTVATIEWYDWIMDALPTKEIDSAIGKKLKALLKKL